MIAFVLQPNIETVRREEPSIRPSGTLPLPIRHLLQTIPLFYSKNSKNKAHLREIPLSDCHKQKVLQSVPAVKASLQ